MKEAIANAGVFNLMIIFIVLLIAFFIGSLGYSKAYKVKNRIIDEIEKDESYEDGTQDRINEWLDDIGYRMNTNSSIASCPSQTSNKSNLSIETVNVSSDYQYCIYRYNITNGAKKSTYYRVITYMYFDVPIINELIKIPVTGETKSFTVIDG